MMNKTSELYHSNMLLQYAMVDPNFLKIAHFLKAWNNELAKGPNHWSKRLNNFTIYMMLIAFMQREKILPNLQALAKMNKHVIIQQLDTAPKECHYEFSFDAQNIHYLRKEDLEDEGLYRDYEMSSGEIVLKFFRFYALNFDPY